MLNTTLHIKIRQDLADGLKELSQKRETSVDELVRQAVLSCYQLDLLNLNEQQRHAVEAFKGTYISLGKFAEEMGMTVWDARNWLEEHDIAQNNVYLDDDVSSACK